MSAMNQRNGGAPTLGESIEDWVTERFGYEHTDEQWYDHVGDHGTKIQVKGTQRWIRDGYYDNGNPRRRRGRFRLWEFDHQKLVQNGGVYLLILYEETRHGIKVNHWQFVKPGRVGDILPGDWHDIDNVRTNSKGRSQRVRWNLLFDEDEVSE